jgi:hypothetical protein
VKRNHTARSRWQILIAVWLGAASLLFADETNRPQSPPAELRHVWTGPSFKVIVSDSWPSGLVPIFSIGESNRVELRRLPPSGHENYSDPVFFALPPADEPRAADIAGHWICTATNANGSRHEPHWELAINGEGVAGRFGQDGEYRVASIIGGVFRSNRLELKIQWINDHYTMTGEWRNGTLSGNWSQQDGSDRGTWLARREGKPVAWPVSQKLAPLYEWRRGDVRRYSIAEKLDEAGWQRAARPLCRVWIEK